MSEIIENDGGSGGTIPGVDVSGRRNVLVFTTECFRTGEKGQPPENLFQKVDVWSVV